MNMLSLHNIGGWYWVINLILCVLFVGGFTALVVWAVMRVTRRGGCCATTNQTPLDIAKERYAKGEITKEQFDQIKKDLN